MRNDLHVSIDLALPIDAATQTFAFIARKGAGKTYAAGKLVELLLDAGVQVVILDAVGNWYGLRLAADGRSKGFDIPVLGGLRGDIPLQAEGGHLIADIICDTGRSLIVDVSQFSKADRQRFAKGLGERLWLRKKAERHPSPVHLVIEESQLIVPENFGGDAAGMVGIYEEIIRLGRNFGIGVTMISQRPQSVNKEVLNQTECLFVGQVSGSHERDALKKWIVHQGMDVKLLDELPGLPIGMFYVWSPQWLQILKKVKISEKKTFDASATPKVGQNRPRRELKPLNLDDLKEKLAATIERAKADDPRELKRRIADLQKQLSARPSAKPIEKIVEKPVVSEKLARDVERIVARLEKDADRRIGMAAKMVESADGLRASGEQLKATGREFASALRGASARPPMAQPAPRAIPAIPPKAAKPATEHEGVVTGPEQRILNSIAWLESIGVPEPDQTAVAFLAGYTYGGGGFNNPRGALNTKGLVAYLSGGRIKLTDEGRALAQAPDEPLTTEGLHEKVCAVLPGPEQRILRPLLKAYPDAMSNEDLAAASGYTNGSGGYNNPRGRLRTLGLIEYRDGGVIARDILFPSEIAP